MVGADSCLVAASRCPSGRRGPFGRSSTCQTSRFINLGRSHTSGLRRGRSFFEEPSAVYGLSEVRHGRSSRQAPSAKCQVLSAVGRRCLSG